MYSHVAQLTNATARDNAVLCEHATLADLVVQHQVQANSYHNFVESA